MRSDELSNKLQQEEQRMLALRSQMNNLYHEIQNVMPTTAASWIDGEVQRRITNHHEVIQALGIEKLRELKIKINELKERLPEMVAAAFQDQSEWSHHTKEGKSNQHSRKDEAHLNKVFREAISNLGSILADYNLISEPKGHYPSWNRVSEGKYRYALNPGISGQLDLKMREYNKLLGEYTALKGEIQTTQNLLSEAKAKELWEQA